MLDFLCSWWLGYISYKPYSWTYIYVHGGWERKSVGFCSSEKTTCLDVYIRLRWLGKKIGKFSWLQNKHPLGRIYTSLVVSNENAKFAW